jgi:hypothetical protein
MVAVVAALLLLASPALAAGPPEFLTARGVEKIVYSTRATVVVQLEPNETGTEWKAEYAPAEKNGEAPPADSPLWKFVNKGLSTGGIQEVFIGAFNPSLPNFGSQSVLNIYLRHLAPDTSYYARFTAKNKDGSATETAPFKTLPLGKPEIPLFYGEATPKPFFHGGSVSGTAAGVDIEVEANGSETTYHVEYSLPEGGHAPAPNSASWTPFTSGGTGTITPAEEYAEVEAHATGLTPETTYYVRVRASNKEGEIIETTHVDNRTSEEVSTFTTLTVKPNAFVSPVRNVTAASAYVHGSSIAPHGEKTVWRLESALSETGPWTPIPGPGSGGVISQALAEATPYGVGAGVEASARLSGLKASTVYYVRLFTENECAVGCGVGTGNIERFETSGAPSASAFAVHAVHGESLRLLGSVNPNSLATSAEQTITLEGAPTGGTFTLTFKGQSTGGTVTGTLTSGSTTVSSIPLAPVTGIGNIVPSPREDQSGEVVDLTTSTGHFHVGEVISGPGLPSGTRINAVKGSTLQLTQRPAEAVAGAALTAAGPIPFVHGETVVGAGIPAGTTVTEVEYAADHTGTLTLSAAAQAGGSGVELTAGLPFDAPPEVLEAALSDLPNEPQVTVEGSAGGPYTVYFAGEVSEPLIEADGLRLAPPGMVKVETIQPGGVAYDTHYRFQYVSQQSFAENGWTGAQESPELDAGSGDTAQYVGYDLPSLTPGETYRYRVVASNTAPGTSLVQSAEQSLTVPAAPVGGEAGACPNEAFRTGPSAHLPDCRSYELLTPVDKAGAQEPFHYQSGLHSGVTVAESGEHAILEAPGVTWPASGQTPYSFARQEGTGWLMGSGFPQPETSVNVNHPQIYSADLTQIAFESQYTTSEVSKSAEVGYALGPVGGPYKTVASVPRLDLKQQAGGWDAANGDFSKLVLATEDRTLVGEEATATKSGYDLYEYTAAGGLRQLNVSGEPAATIGVCGASVAYGKEGGKEFGRYSGPHTVSADGSRVFFEAVLGSNCSEASHLYMRTDGESTVDIGAYRFAAANSQGTEVLLEKGDEFFLYDTEAATVKHLFNFSPSVLPVVSEDFTDIYLNEGGGLYRYDIATETLSFITQGANSSGKASADGRYFYYEGAVAGLLGGGVIRYDSAENVLECISCASSFDPEPKQPAFITNADNEAGLNGGVPQFTAVSANGDFAFFSTPAALVPQDANGEIPIVHGKTKNEFNDLSNTTSPSSDIYEWRKDGVDGCAQVQGCVALITDGRAGYRNLLLGTANEGRDVFVYTRSKLLPQDDDNSGDIYDARIGGGFAPAPPPAVECEADACSTPPAPPNDATPSSLTFNGAGNLISAAAPTPKATTKKTTKKKVKTKKKKTKGRHRAKKAGKHAKRSSRDRRAR